MSKMSILVILLTLLTTFGTNDALAHIKVHCGQLSVEGYQKCEITHNNQLINYTGPEKKLISDLRFGLITYKCDHMAGHLVSEFDCKKCDFYCPNEGSHEDCHEDSLGTWMGFIMGICLSPVIIFCICKSLHKYHMLTVVTTIFLFATVGACDYTIVMQHNVTTMFCDGTKCSSVQPPAFHVAVGEEVCIDDDAGERVVLQVSEITYRSRYALAYYISDYKWANVTVIGNCCSEPGNRQKCYDETKAKMDAEYKGGKNKTKGFDWEDTHDELTMVSCMYFGQNERVGQEYPIYQMVGQTWIVDVVARKDNDFRNLVVSAYEPVHKSIGFKLHEVDQIPISVTGVEVPERQISKIMLYYDDFIFHNSAENNFFLGDSELEFQDLAGKERYPSPEAEHCTKTYAGCSCNCSFSAAKSKMSQFVQKRNGFTKTNAFLIQLSNKSVIDTFDTFKEGSVQMRIGDWNIDDSTIKEAKCDIQLLTTYACTSCNESSYIVLQAQNIEREGQVPIYTNCSFDKEYVNCDFEPTKLILTDTYRSCFIGMPTLKTTVLVELKYDLPSDIRRRENCTLTFTGYDEAFKHLFTSSQFIKSLAMTIIIICSLFCLLVLVSAFLSRNR